MEAKRIVFLYSEMAGYFLAAVSELVNQGAEVLVVHWPVKSEAPFDFKVLPGVQLLDKSTISLSELEKKVSDFQPNAIITSGWMDKDYLKITKEYFRKIPTIMAFDNHWDGGVKQRVLSIIAPFWLKRIFSKIWAAGAPQVAYARKLGFTDNNILRGFYTADVPKFEQQYLTSQAAKAITFPKVFLYVGRYIHHKGIFDLWNAFISLEDEQPNDWELWCVGTGELYDQRLHHPKIKHLGFLQPDELANITPQAGVLVLPSHFEPWGVVVHEFAAAGFPMLLSEKIGAATQFLDEGKNGFTFKSNHPESLQESLQKIIACSDEELIAMGKMSNVKAQELTPVVWATTLLAAIPN